MFSAMKNALTKVKVNHWYKALNLYYTIQLQVLFISTVGCYVFTFMRAANLGFMQQWLLNYITQQFFECMSLYSFFVAFPNSRNLHDGTKTDRNANIFLPNSDALCSLAVNLIMLAYLYTHEHFFSTFVCLPC